MNTVGQANDTSTYYINLFEANRGTILKQGNSVQNELRNKALAAFSKLGIPSSKNENYKYTNIQPFFSGALNADMTMQLAPIDKSELNLDNFKCEVPQLDTHQIIIVNGWFVQLKSNEELPKGVIISSLRDFSSNHTELFEKYYGKAAPIENDGMVALNTMWALDGFVIYIPKGTVINNPIQVLNISTGNTDKYINQRNLIIAEERSEASVMICDHTLTAQRFAINSVTEGFANNEAQLNIYGLQSQHNFTTQVAGIFIKQGPKSNAMVNTLTLHSGITRNNVAMHMEGEHCESHAYGLYVTDKNQHVDNNIFIDHAVPNCFSSELFKGILDDASSGAFTGRILVRPDAQKTNAYQSNKSLLLTNDAKVNTKPQLEIYADDVKCSHGATVGQLDQKSMFYLRSRGLSMEEARILLMYAFAYEVIEKIKIEPLKEHIRGLVEKRFRGEIDKCDSCVSCGQLGNKLTCL